MEDKNELSDIVLEKNDGNKSQNFKRILVGAAVLVLVFLVVLIVMRALNKPQTPTTDSRLVLPPEPSAKVVKTDEPKDDQLFKQVPIIEEESKKESFEDMVKKLKEKEIKRTEVKEEVVEPVKEPTQKIVQEVKKVEPKKEEVKKVVQKVEEPPKKVATTLTKVQTTSSTSDKTATSGTYIQVAATSKSKPDAKYLTSLTKKSYDYRLYKVDIKGKTYTKILIGPYKSSSEANTALAKIKSDINKNAFIFRVP